MHRQWRSCSFAPTSTDAAGRVHAWISFRNRSYRSFLCPLDFVFLEEHVVGLTVGISHAQQDTDQKILSGYSMITRTSLLSVVSARATCAVERTLA
ncbi:hypothetical protein EMIT0P4_110109 [Pseudomonas sp. IT-P4]